MHSSIVLSLSLSLLGIGAGLLVGSSGARAESHAAADCSSTAVQAAIDGAGDGDIVTVPACPAGAWADDVLIPSHLGITLQGAGADQTIITTGSSLRIDTRPSNAPVRVTGFRFVRTNGAARVYMLGTAQDWRIDHNVFDDARITGFYTIQIGEKGNENLDSYNFGVIDHNEFINRNYSTSIHVSWVRWGDAMLDEVSGDWIWEQPAERGTGRAVFIEDNVFSGDDAASQVVDTQYGGMVVVRYNSIHNPWIATHSGCTNRGRHSPWTEVYQNRFTADDNRYGGSSVELRSTSGIVWGNTATPALSRLPLSVDHERSWRSDCSGTYGGLADGTQPFDENVGLHGYRALGQPGWGPPQATDMSAATFAGVFAWDNFDGTDRSDLFIANDTGFTSEHLVFGRELFNAEHMTAGPGASRPTTCTVGPPRDVFMANDENPQGATLYVCSAPDVWSKHWEPFTYPHPLVGGGGGVPDAGTGDAGPGDSGPNDSGASDAGPRDTGVEPGDATMTPDVGGTGDETGCACGVTSDPRPSLVWFGLAVLPWLLRRRSRVFVEST